MKRVQFIVFGFLLMASGCNRPIETSSTNAANNVAGAPSPVDNRVTLYCSVDDVYARPIIKRLEAKTGLRIDTLFDTEATKTAGLANRIRAERSRPQGDVFWSSALLQTLLLQREGLLGTYISPSAKDIPTAFKDPKGAWTALGVRSRVIIYRKGLANPPKTIDDLTQPRFKNAVGISNPQFGTSSDEAAALFVRRGEKATLNLYRALKANGVMVLPGNSVVAERVARGELMAGTTDTDDYLAQQKKSAGLGVGSYGVAVPGAVAILENAPHPEAAKKLVDALLEAQTENAFAAEMPGVTALRPTAGTKRSSEGNPNYTSAPNDSAQWPAAWDKVRDPLAEILLKG
jgi:iron(III) transport system substrate-binding protein